MRARDVVGKRIVAIDQVRWWNAHLGRFMYTVERIRLEDGSHVYPAAFATENLPEATIYYTPPRPKAP